MCLAVISRFYRYVPQYVPSPHSLLLWRVLFFRAAQITSRRVSVRIMWFELSRGGNNICYASMKSSLSAPLNVPLFPYYAHANKYSWLAITATLLPSPSLIDKPATYTPRGQRVYHAQSQELTFFCTSSRRVYCLPRQSMISGAAQVHGNHM
jgi:hypothetical protein